MCFHFNFHQTAEKVSERFQAEYKQGELLTPAHFNGFSFPQTPVILDEKPQLIQPINWGLIPFWAKEKTNRNMKLAKPTMNSLLLGAFGQSGPTKQQEKL